jgi:hypothetical protein
MKIISYIGVLALILLMAGSASACSLTLVKTASPATYDHVGQKITYTYKVTCTAGNVYGPIILIDDKTTPAPIAVSTKNGYLTYNNVVTGWAEYNITQADLDAGYVTNEAYASGKQTQNGKYTVISTKVKATVYADQRPNLTITKSAFPTTYSSINDVITYTYVVKNAGNVNLTNIAVRDDHINNSRYFTILNGNLAVGSQVTATQNYSIKKKDFPGPVTNLANASGNYHNYKNSNKQIKSNDATATVEVAKPALTIEKSALPETYDTVGQTITYTYKVTNSGNVDISGPITVIDNKVSKVVQISSDGLAKGRSVSGTATYTINQDDLNAGSVTNTAHASGYFNNSPITSKEVSKTVTAVPNTTLYLEKAASPETYSSTNDVITYTYKVTNLGNVKIKGPIKITDNKIAPFSIPGDLEPDQIVTGTASYNITQQDIDAGSVTNIAHAKGTFNNSDVPSNEATETVTKEKITTNVPEFPTMVLPVAAILGLISVFSRRKND